ncbi:MAG: glutamine--fructose-6-phosphate transaminase (isomerizing) [Albidovulum sp.]|nr:glutamine--fructose-6-phosphate transaminase (isomerizing) [Albidovulum sp.]
MCGIVGVAGRKDATPVLLSALKRLEYRGYDSAGIATIHSGKLSRRRSIGKITDLSDIVANDPLAGNTGIGHTRWATHGRATLENAHPHRAGGVAVVHNGIIENYLEIRERLSELGYSFESETDTEAVATLCQHQLSAGMSPCEAATETIGMLTGAFALCFLFEGSEDFIFAARKGSPLAIGHGDGEVFLASDAYAFAPLTTRATFLEEGDRVVVKSSGAQFYDIDGNAVRRPELNLQFDSENDDKCGYEHFMAKEIMEQPVALKNAASQFSILENGAIALPATLDFANFDRLALVACGTAHYACCVAKYWFEQFAGIPADVDIASEFRYRSPLIDEGTLAIFVSQSGETADTLAAMRYAKGKSVKTAGILNNVNSTLARECDAVVPIRAGIEKSVASTKAFTCQLLVLGMLAVAAGERRGFLKPECATEYFSQFQTAPSFVSQAFAAEPALKKIAEKIRRAKNAIFFGRGTMFPLALEGALKLKEVSYIHAEGFAGGELKHGPIALVENDTPIFILAPSTPLFSKTASNFEEVKARGNNVHVITDRAGADRIDPADATIVVLPNVEPLVAPIVYAVAVQQLAYHAAVARNTNVDQPQNLAKSVTVE